MKIRREVSSAGDRFIAALASTRLPDVSTRQELGEATLTDSRITRMLEDFAANYGWDQRRNCDNSKGGRRKTCSSSGACTHFGRMPVARIC